VIFKCKACPTAYTRLCPQGSPGRDSRTELPCLWAQKEQVVMGKLSPLTHPLVPESFSADGDTGDHIRLVLVGGLDAKAASWQGHLFPSGISCCRPVEGFCPG